MTYRIKTPFWRSTEYRGLCNLFIAQIHVPLAEAVASPDLFLNVRNALLPGDEVMLIRLTGEERADHKAQRVVEYGKVRIYEIGADFVDFGLDGDIVSVAPRPAREQRVEGMKPIVERQLSGGYAVKDGVHIIEWFPKHEDALAFAAKTFGVLEGNVISASQPDAEKPRADQTDRDLSKPVLRVVKSGRHYLVQDSAGATVDSFKTKDAAEEYVSAYGAR